MGDRKDKTKSCSEPQHDSTQPTVHAAARSAETCTVDKALDDRAAARNADVLQLSRTHLTFAAVIGRPSLSENVIVTNIGRETLMYDARIETNDEPPAFALESPTHDAVASAVRDPSGQAVEVRYRPRVVGSHSATLVISTRYGDARISMHGTATALGMDAPALVQDGTPEPIRVLPDVAANGNGDSGARASLSRAIEAVSALPSNFETLSPHLDGARNTFSDEILKAGDRLTAQVIAWLKDEGISETMRANAHVHGAEQIFEAFLNKGKEKFIEEAFEIGGAQLGATMFAIELGTAPFKAARANEEADERVAQYKEHVGPAFDLAKSGMSAASKELMRRFGSVLSSYAAARADIRRIAGTESAAMLADLQHADPHGGEAAYLYAKAQGVMENYNASMKAWGAATSMLATSAIQAVESVDMGFRAMLKEYLNFRAENAHEEAQPKSLAGFTREQIQELVPEYGRENGKRITVIGGIDLADTPNVQFGSYDLGEYNDLSSTMQIRVAAMSISDLEQWDVEVRLAVAQGGSVTLKRNHEGAWSTEFDGPGETAVREIGEEHLRQIVENQKLGKSVAKVR